jgi:membrane-associated phospholipid phosphatase
VYFHTFYNTAKSNKYFLATFVILWLTGLWFQLTVPQFVISQKVNGTHTPFGDLLMQYLTHAGDGYFVAVTGIIIVLIRKRYWLLTLLALSVPGLITQLLKRLVFAGHHRPAILMANYPDLHYITGIYMNQHNSFPSGHTTAAFSLYTLLALLTARKQWGPAWVIIAASIAISRVYLLQHFWQDILAGALIGTLVTFIIFTFFAAKLNPDAIQE